MFLNGISKPGTEHVRINLGCGDIGMTQHDLHATQVGATFQKMSGETVAKHVRGQAVKDTCFSAIPGQELPERLTG
jgi:hypothetical protein